MIICPLVDCLNLLLWHSVWWRSMTFPTINTTPIDTYYHVGTSGDAWWLNLIDWRPPYYGEPRGRHRLLTHAAAPRLRNYLDFLCKTAATKRQKFRHRYIVSVVVAWGHRICVGVIIWGRICPCRMCRFYMHRVNVIIETYPPRNRPRRPQKRILRKIWVGEHLGVVVIVYFMADNAMWCIRVGVLFVWCVIFWWFFDEKPLDDADATDLTPPISRRVDGM